MHRFPLHTLVPILLLTACPKEDDKTGDTKDESDADTDADGDSDTDADADADLTFEITGSAEGSTLLLHPFVPGEDFSSFGEPLVSVVVDDNPFGVAAGAPPEEALIELDPEGAPGMLAAFYIPTLHDDADADGQYTKGESVIGAGKVWALYLAGTIPEELADLGFTEGWNGIADIAQDKPDPTWYDPNGLPIDGRYDSFSIGGTYAGAEGTMGLALFPAVMLDGVTVVDYLIDGPLDTSEPWTMTWPGAPPEDHFAENSKLYGGAAIEYPLVYEDVDGDGNLDLWDPDPAMYVACYGGYAVLLSYAEGYADVETAVTLSLRGVHTGWNVFANGKEGPAFLDEEERGSLELGPGCSL